MIPIQLLEDADILQPDDWCRPLHITSMSGGSSDYYSFKSMYAGTPENNVKWVRVKAVIGACWIGKPLKKFKSAISKVGSTYEFARGDIPKSHRLCMDGYVDLSTVSAKVQGEDSDTIF